MAEMGHTDPALAFAIYAQAMRRDEGENARLRALVNGESLEEFPQCAVPPAGDGHGLTASGDTFAA
jgi:hypothetical protein